VANWRPRLRQLKELGIFVATFYVPWRHHEVGGELGFDRRTQPNRNVRLFLDTIKDEGMYAVDKAPSFTPKPTSADFSTRSWAVTATSP